MPPLSITTMFQANEQIDEPQTSTLNVDLPQASTLNDDLAPLVEGWQDYFSQFEILGLLLACKLSLHSFVLRYAKLQCDM